MDQGSVRDFDRAKNIFGENLKFTVKRLRDTLNKQTRAAYKLLDKWLAFGMATRLDEKEKNAYLHQLDPEWELEGARLITPEDLEKLIEDEAILQGQSGKVDESTIYQTIDSENTLPISKQSQGKVHDGVNKELPKQPLQTNQPRQKENPYADLPEEMKALFTSKIEDEEESPHQLPDFLKSAGKEFDHRDCPF